MRWGVCKAVAEAVGVTGGGARVVLAVGVGVKVGVSVPVAAAAMVAHSALEGVLVALMVVVVAPLLGRPPSPHIPNRG